MAHTPRLSGFSHAFTAAPVPTRTAQAPEDDVAALDRAAAKIQPSWAHLIGPHAGDAAPSSLASSRREASAREPGDVAAEAFAARRAGAPVRRRTARDDDSLAEFPRTVRGRRSAAFWLALVALAALGVAWALSDEPSAKRETRATSPASPLPIAGAAAPTDARAQQRASMIDERAAAALPEAASRGLAGQNSGVTPPARAATLPAATPSAQVDARGLALGQGRGFAGGTASASAISAPSLVRGAAPAAGGLATARGTGLASKPASPARPLARPLPVAARGSKFARSGAVPASTAADAPPAEVTALRLKAEAAQATAELTMQVEPVGQPLGELPQRAAIGSGEIGTNPYDDEL